MEGSFMFKWVLIIHVTYVTANKSTGYDIFQQLLKYLRVETGES